MKDIFKDIVNRAQSPEILQKVKQVFKSPEFLYPWEKFEQDLRKQGRTNFPLIGYGSLINLTSAARTIPPISLKHSRPVVALGFRRNFDYEIPTHLQRYKKYVDSKARAALNVHETGMPSDLVNGLLFDLPLKEISGLRDREVDYDLVPAVCLHWNNLEQPPLEGFILRCKKRPKEIISPNIDYYLICRKGAEKIGKEFLKFWLSTTYLLDNKTTVADWEKNVTLPRFSN